jgi:hypothetical protein
MLLSISSRFFWVPFKFHDDPTVRWCLSWEEMAQASEA